MYEETIEVFAKQAAEKVHGQRTAFIAHFTRSMLAGMYVGAAVVLILIIGAFLPVQAGHGD
jgi:formate/nitrite transporter FocA (FNT family)